MDYVIRNIEKNIFEIRKIYGGGTRRYGGAGRSSPSSDAIMEFNVR